MSAGALGLPEDACWSRAGQRVRAHLPPPLQPTWGRGVHGKRSCTPQVSKGPGPLSAQLFCMLCPGVSPAPAWHLFCLRVGGGGEESPGQEAAFVRTCPGGDSVCLSNGPDPLPGHLASVSLWSVVQLTLLGEVLLLKGRRGDWMLGDS